MPALWKKISAVTKVEKLRSVVFNPENCLPMMAVMFALEIFVNVWVIRNIKCEYG